MLFDLESFLLISGVSGFLFFTIELIRKPGIHGKLFSCCLWRGDFCEIFRHFREFRRFRQFSGIDLAKKEELISTSSKFINLNIFHVLLYCKKVSQHHGFATFLENFGAFPDILILQKTIKQPENNIYYHFDFAILLKVCIFNVQVCNKLRILVKNWDLNTKLHCLRAIWKPRY